LRLVPDRVVIVGGGFAGLWATRALERVPVSITLIDRTNHHLFQPLLYQVATAGLSSPDIAAPLRHVLRRQRNVTVQLGEVTGVCLADRCVHVAGREPVGYDWLILATGAQHAYFGRDAWGEFAPGLKTLADALDVRARILRAFECAETSTSPEDVREWLDFAVIGGGPTGVELAGTLAEIARHTLRREFRRIDPASARVQLIEAGPRILPSFPEALSERAREQLVALGVEVRCGTPVTHIDAGGLVRGDERVAARTILWAAGVAASPLAATLGVAVDRAGRVLVETDLSVPGHPEVFVVGDLAAVRTARGAPVPGVAPAAKQMGAHAARVIRTGVRSAFRYRDYGNLATVGRSAAVVELGRLRFSGWPAWAFWLLAHLFFLIGFRNRLLVLVNWAWAYWTYQRHARIIIDR
jgi:NADH dehydrogenase